MTHSPNKLQLSRNKREGRYVGRRRGVNTRNWRATTIKDGFIAFYIESLRDSCKFKVMRDKALRAYDF